MKKRFRTQFTTSYKGEKGELNTQDSVTVPDDSLSVRQLLINHTRGLATTTSQRQGVYTEDMVAPIYKDITEVQEDQKNIADNLKKAEKDAEEEIIKNKASREAKEEPADPTPTPTPKKASETAPEPPKE